MKKLLAMALALVMALGLCSVSWAEEYDGLLKANKAPMGWILIPLM